MQKKHINGLGDYVITSGLTDNGVLGKTDIPAKVFEKRTITIDMFGCAFYRQFQYKMVTHARVFSLKPKLSISDNHGIFFSICLKFLSREFGYENMCSWEKIKSKKIKLPTKDGKIDFDFMESFIAELEAQRIAELSAYLKVSGYDNYELSTEELHALRDFEKLEWDEFEFAEIFNRIEQGRRLKKDDQIPGTIPFVMSGVTNTGVVNYISNPVASFPKNSITIDIFGNAFYRNYDFGAGDDTGVYWNNKKDYTQNLLLFFTTSMEKSLSGKYSYGKKLRSSQSYKCKMQLPTKDGEIDFELMDSFISAIKKLAIRDVVLYSDRKIAATKSVVGE